jgi:hypothetical protein
MRVHHVRLHVAKDLPELPGRMHVELALRREADVPQPFPGPALQLAALVRNQQGRLVELGQPGHREQHLVLTAAPGPRRVDVDGADRHHQSPISACPETRRAASFGRSEVIAIFD